MRVPISHQFAYLSLFESVKKGKSLSINNPTLAEEWDYTKNKPLTPDNVAVNSHQKVWWICKDCGYSWNASVISRNRNQGCPACAGNRCLKGINDLVTKNSSLLKSWNYAKNEVEPYDVTPYSSRKVWWVCPDCGYEWEAQINNRTKGSGCPACAGKVVISGKNDLATLSPYLLEEWDFQKNSSNQLYPDKILPYSNNKAWWICKKCGYSWEASVCNRSKGAKCPICARHNRIEASKKKVLCIETGIVYDSIQQAAQSVGRGRESIRNCCSGKTDHCAGFHWRFI